MNYKLKENIMREFVSKKGIRIVEYYDFGADTCEVNGIRTHRTFNDLLDELRQNDIMPALWGDYK